MQQAPWLDYIRSYSKPGEAVVFIIVQESAPAQEAPGIWYQVRKKVGDMHHELPAGAQGLISLFHG